MAALNVLALLAALTGLAHAAPPPAVAAPAAPLGDAVTAAPLTPQDRSFVEQYLTGALAEIELGELASRRARHTVVRELARRMADDHRTTSERLVAMVAPLRLGPLPDAPSAVHKALALQLEDADPADFDRLYVDAQVRDHEDHIRLLEMQRSSGDHSELRKFAADLLPMVREHLQQLRALAQELRRQDLPPPTETP